MKNLSLNSMKQVIDLKN